jgi:dihydroorotase/N-acyl-D-amino-acid deacylase
VALTLCAGACAPRARPAPVAPLPAGYDVVITGGRLVDGTGNAWFYGDVGVIGSRIARVAPAGLLRDAPAKRRIDASGLVVAPGVIDIQAQSYGQLLAGDSRVVSMVTQGVTMMVLGEGDTPAPTNDRMIAAAQAEGADTLYLRLMRAFTGAHGFDAWFRAMESHGTAVNVGSFLGAGTVRAYAKGMAEGAATPADLDTMRRVVRDAMRDGAFGVASALIYPPGSYAATEELI